MLLTAGVAVGVAVAAIVGVDVAVDVAVHVGVGVAAAVGVLVAVGVALGIGVAVTVGPGVAALATGAVAFKSATYPSPASDMFASSRFTAGENRRRVAAERFPSACGASRPAPLETITPL